MLLSTLLCVFLSSAACNIACLLKQCTASMGFSAGKKGKMQIFISSCCCPVCSWALSASVKPADVFLFFTKTVHGTLLYFLISCSTHSVSKLFLPKPEQFVMLRLSIICCGKSVTCVFSIASGSWLWKTHSITLASVLRILVTISKFAKKSKRVEMYKSILDWIFISTQYFFSGFCYICCPSPSYVYFTPILLWQRRKFLTAKCSMNLLLV